ncbi:hypothetical protein F4678DRAFT_412101, partial [Xylaria arbuscula]
MPLELLDVNPAKDFPELTERLIEAFEHPPQGFIHAYFAPPSRDEVGRRERINEAATRYESWNEHSPNNYWQKVIDTQTGAIVGGALWKIYSEDPFAEQHSVEATWLPNDGSRKFAEAFLKLYATPRAALGRRPQVYLSIIFTSPSHRRRGLAQQIMSWGIEKANQMGVEMFIDATEMGKPLYEQNGFTCVEVNKIIPKTECKDEGWKELEERVGPITTLYLMWRPSGGPYVEGKTTFPWV